MTEREIIDELTELADKADEVLEGDSNDDEHDALFEICRELRTIVQRLEKE